MLNFDDDKINFCFVSEDIKEKNHDESRSDCSLAKQIDYNYYPINHKRTHCSINIRLCYLSQTIVDQINKLQLFCEWHVSRSLFKSESMFLMV